jgi:hypothetical protein
VILTLTAHFTEFAAAAFLHLAEGAWRLRDYSRARQHALKALRIALSRDEAGLAEEATDLTLLLTAGARPDPEREPLMEGELAAATRRLIAALHGQRP